MQATLVTSGNGKTGRRVAERLTQRGLPVRIGSRSGQPPFDWDDRSTWAPALEGMEAVYVAYQPDAGAPGAADAVGSFARLAVDSGVRRLVLLSGRGEPQAQPTEQAIQVADAAWTVVTGDWFMQNFSEDFLLEPVLSGEIMIPAADVPEPFVDVEDVADVAVAALTGEDGRHDGQVYVVSGPRAVTFTQVAEEISAASGRQVRFVPVTPAEYTAGMTQAGYPEPVAEYLTDMFTTVLDGRNSQPADGVQRALGRKPRDFSDFVREAAATGVWDRA